MKLVMMGPPGAGKGTQAELLAKELQVPHISSGDMLKDAAKKGTQAGIEAKEYWTEGLLVPDEIITKLVKERLELPDCSKGFILDGYPRTLSQAKSLLDIGIQVDSVVNIQVPDSAIVDRMVNRVICSGCQAVYNLVTNPPKTESVCDKCGGTLQRRSDDTEEVIRKRLTVYHEQTRPLLNFYEERKLLKEIDGTKSIEEVHKDTLAAIKQ